MQFRVQSESMIWAFARRGLEGEIGGTTRRIGAVQIAYVQGDARRGLFRYECERGNKNQGGIHTDSLAARAMGLVRGRPMQRRSEHFIERRICNLIPLVCQGGVRRDMARRRTDAAAKGPEAARR